MFYILEIRFKIGEVLLQIQYFMPRLRCGASGRKDFTMALWDDIAKSAKDAAAYTMKKTEELTSIAKIKMSIHSEENNLDKCFAEIGSLYYAYQRQGEDHTSEIAALLMEADQAQAKIKCLRDSLAKLQKSVICPGCSAQVTTEYDFCPLCGAKLKDEAAQQDEADSATDEEA